MERLFGGTRTMCNCAVGNTGDIDILDDSGLFMVWDSCLLLSLLGEDSVARLGVWKIYLVEAVEV